MTVEASFTTAATPFAFRAAIATLSHGRRLDADTTALLHRLMAQAGLPEPTQQALLADCAAGLRPTDAADATFASEDEAIQFLTALTQFALRVSPNWREATRLPELIASNQRLPYDVIQRMASRLGPDLEAIHGHALEANLRAYLAPGEDMRAIAQWIAGSLHPAHPTMRDASHIPVDSFQHPLDVQAIGMLQGFAGFDELTRLIYEHGFERIFRIYNLSGAIRVGPDQFPELYAIYQDCVRRAGVSPEPELYVGPGGLNAHTSGVERPYILLNSGAVSMLARAELEYIIGHELGHIKCQHLLYLFMAQYLPHIAKFLPVVGPFLSFGLSVALGEWLRKAELSCDRMGLLVAQDLDACHRVMIKCSGAPGVFHHRIDVPAFLRQAEEFQDLDRDMLNMVFKLMATMGNSHPWTVERASELKRWVDEGGYDAAFASRPIDPYALPPRPAGPVLEAPEAPVVVNPPDIPVPEVAREAQLASLLDELRRGLDRAGDAPLADAVAGLMAQREARPHTTVIVGEKGRGKSVAIRRLVGARPIHAQGLVRHTHGPSWRLNEDGTFEGPAPILRFTQIVDTPGLNDADGAFDAAVMRAAVEADALVIVVSATQLLTERERELIQSRLLSVAGDRSAIAVTHMDQLETDDDRREAESRVRRFLKQAGHAHVPVFYLDGAPSDPAPGLAAFLEAAAAEGGSHAGRAWPRKALALLTAVQAAIGAPEGEGPTEADRQSATSLLQRHHAAALSEAESHIHSRIAAIRLGLGARLDGAGAPVPVLVETVQRIGHEAFHTYRDAFARGLLTDAPDELRRGLVHLSGGTVRVDRPSMPTPHEATRNPLLVGATAVGAGLLIFTGGLALPVVGAIGLGTAHELRRGMDRASQARNREEAIAALNAWLEEAERTLIEQLRAAAAQALQAAQARAGQALDRPRIPAGDAARLRTLTRDALTLVQADLDAPTQEE